MPDSQQPSLLWWLNLGWAQRQCHRTMASNKIPLPSQFTFSTEITLYQSHMNARGRLDHAMLLEVVSEARVRFLKSLGYAELNVEGVGIQVVEAEMQYSSEAFFAEVMVVQIGAIELKPRGFHLVWSMNEKITQREIARGISDIVFFDNTSLQVVSMPSEFRIKLTKLGSSAVLDTQPV